jgi:hypothetical protein
MGPQQARLMSGIRRCRSEFDQTGKEQEAAELAALSPDDREQKLRKNRQRMLGNVEFIGELFKRKMVGVEEVELSLNKLVTECEEDMDKIQLLCKFLEGVGKVLEAQTKEMIDGCFQKIDGLLSNTGLSSRFRFMLMDLIDLRSNGWVPRRAASGPKTLEEVQKEVDKENRFTEKKKEKDDGKGKKADGRKEKKGGKKDGKKDAAKAEDEGWSQVTTEKQKGKQQVSKKSDRQKPAKEEPPPSPSKAAPAGKPPAKAVQSRGGFAALMGDDEGDEEDEEDEDEVGPLLVRARVHVSCADATRTLARAFVAGGRGRRGGRGASPSHALLASISR